MPVVQHGIGSVTCDGNHVRVAVEHKIITAVCVHRLRQGEPGIIWTMIHDGAVAIEGKDACGLRIIIVTPHDIRDIAFRERIHRIKGRRQL